jgi:hypothetical protein
MRKFGVVTVRTASGVAQALREISDHPPEFAVLDVNLGTETSFEIAKRLAEIGVPFVFATGYGEQVAFPPEFSDVPKLRPTRSTRCARRSNAGPTRQNATGDDVCCSTRLRVKRRVTTFAAPLPRPGGSRPFSG